MEDISNDKLSFQSNSTEGVDVYEEHMHPNALW